jgi:hypothetical protein
LSLYTGCSAKVGEPTKPMTSLSDEEQIRQTATAWLDAQKDGRLAEAKKYEYWHRTTQLNSIRNWKMTDAIKIEDTNKSLRDSPDIVKVATLWVTADYSGTNGTPISSRVELMLCKTSGRGWVILTWNGPE